MTTRLVDHGWSKELTDALAFDSSHVRIISPFIKESVIESLLSYKPRKLQVITRFNLGDFADRVSDVDALRSLTDANAQVRGVKNLHAKLYVFGSTRTIITSANLTDAGLNRNFELGTVSEDAALVRACQRYFDDLWEKASDVQHSEINDWTREIKEWQLRGGRPDDTKRLGDYGADIGLAAPPRSYAPVNVGTTQQAFIKFLGRGTKEHREPLLTPILDEIKSSGCHWALSYGPKKTPRSVDDGAVMFIGRFTRDPDDVRIFGRAIGMQYVEVRDDAPPDDISKRPWKKDYPRYIRVHHAEFVAGTLENGVSRDELMRSLESDSFASTQHHARIGSGNTDPKRACRQQAAMRLTPESHAWLEERLLEAFKAHDKVPQHELDTLDWPGLA